MAIFSTPLLPLGDVSALQVIGGSLSGLTILACAWFGYTFVLVPQWHPLNVLPGPKPTSLLYGNGKETMGAYRDWKYRSGTYPEPFLSWITTYGGMVHYRVFFSHRVLVSDPKALQHILVTHATNFPRHRVMRTLFESQMGGVGLLSAEGRQHDQQRKLLNPHFALDQLKSFVAIFDAQTAQCVSTVLDPACDAALPIDLYPVFKALTLDIVGRSALGYDLQADPNVLAAYEALQLQPSALLFWGMYCIPGFLNLPLPSLRTRRAAHAVLNKLVTTVLQHKTTHATTLSTIQSSYDLLDRMVASDASLSGQEASVHMLTFLAAGHDTTSATLSWVMAMVASHPEHVARLRAELAAVLGANPSLPRSLDALHALPFLTAFIHETLRLHTTAVNLTRRTTLQDDHVPLSDGGSAYLPKGTTINVCLAAMHRNPKYWSQPHEFVPDRFIDGTAAFDADVALRGTKSHTFVFFPFSVGAKNCIGQRFAMAELLAIVSTLVRTYDFHLAADADLRPAFTGIGLRPAKLTMHVSRATN
ncbi:Aste57867_23527 [Aphanomyces stellatus]|uniref:Aste57867_23527 protein n=1 Tax=Aphanomyces stellatus TaxID=120398 RepID=A0A485LSG9_9STRA|nr:hypothetical protein As57867_023456 [Aphanomyces stellatus]VFU00172.1 Aste57867_23527 [Aphanomyces stellatus]